VPRKQYDQVTKDLRPIDTAINADQAMVALEAFEAKWPELSITGRMWREAWHHVIPFLAFEPEVRRLIYTTNAIEALNRQPRNAIKTKGSFPSEEAAIKLLYPAIHNAVPQWTRTRGWTKAMLAFKIQFGELQRSESPRVVRGRLPVVGSPANVLMLGPFRQYCALSTGDA
jgi:putative transposase